MMRAFATFVMRGRKEAWLVALMGIPLLSQAACGLVCLRKGVNEGALATLFMSAPAIFLLATVGTGSLPLLLPYFLTAALVLLGAQVLRSSRSWSLALTITSMGSIALTLLLSVSVDSKELLVEALRQSQQEGGLNEVDELIAALPDSSSILSVVSMIASVITVLSLVVARWMQAILYNPEGFGEEFRAIRLEPKLLILCLGSYMALSFLAAEIPVANLALLPVIVAGLGLVHCLVLGAIPNSMPRTVFYVLLYIALLRAPVLALLLVFLATGDSLVDLRKRFNLRQ